MTEQATKQAKVRNRWLREIAESSQHEEPWRKRAKKVVDRYRDERDSYENGDSRFNILYANTEILKGAVYARRPVPIVRRRWNSGPPAAEVAAKILERCLSYSIESYDFDQLLKDSTEDMLLPGRAQSKIRYIPQIVQAQRRIEVANEWGESELPDGVERDPKGTYRTETYDKVVYEQVQCEYVEWRWFRFSRVTRWKKCKWVAFGELLTRSDLINEFGEEIGNACKLSWKADSSNPDEETKESRALVWTIWNKPDKRVYVVSEGYEKGPMKVEDDPLRLENFFPCPEPVYDVKTTDSLIPVPNFCLYQDQADELDIVSARITVLINALKVRGAFDSNFPELEKIAKAGDNEYLPVENAAAMRDAGGLEKAILHMPVEQIIKVLQGLYVQREQCLKIIYDVTGISDVVRGSSEAQETATAQQIKAQYGSVRISGRQQVIAKYAVTLIRMKAEVIAEHFSPETMSLMSGIQLPTTEQKALAQQQAMLIQQQQQPIPEQLQKILSTPTWDDVLQILRNDKLRSFSIEIETDSTIAVDDAAEKESVGEMVTAIGALTQSLAPAVQVGFVTPEAAKAILKFSLRKFKASREIEDEIEKIIPQAQDPQIMLQQMQQQIEQMQAQIQEKEQKLNQEMAQREKNVKANVAAEKKIVEADMHKQQSNNEIAVQKIQSMLDSFTQQLKVPETVAKEKGDAQTQASVQQMAKESQEMAKQLIQALLMANGAKNVQIMRDPITQRATELQVTPTRLQ